MSKSGDNPGRRSKVTASVKTAMEDILDLVPFGIILVDAAGRAVFINDCGREIVGGDGGLALVNDRLVAATPRETTTLKDLIAATASATDDRTEPAVMILSQMGQSPPLPIVFRRLGGDQRAAVVAIFVDDPASDDEATDAILIRLYGLTATEARLTLNLLTGKGLAWAATKNKISLNTARTHLKRVFTKTETHRQVELVRLILRGPALLRLSRTGGS